MKLAVGLGALPRRLRLAGLLAVLFTGVCGLLSAWEAFSLVHQPVSLAHLSELKAPPSSTPLPPYLGAAEWLQAAQAPALEQMREPRMVVLFTLALACSLSFVASTRLLRPAGLPREGVRRILVWALVAAAALRTIDGAQAAVLLRSAADALAHQLPAASMSPSAAEQLHTMLAPGVMVAAAALQTAVVVALFLLLSQYFRSLPVKEWVAREDGRTA